MTLIEDLEQQLLESQKAYNHQAHCAHLLSKEVERLKEERLRYQDIVYAMCNFLDAALGNSPSRGTGIIANKTEIMVAMTKLFHEQRAHANQQIPLCRTTEQEGPQ